MQTFFNIRIGYGYDNNIMEIRALTGIRGLAALYVAIFHWSIVNGKDNINLGVWNDFVLRGHYAVDLFFILSGFVLSAAVKDRFKDGVDRRDWWHFMLKRFSRLYPMYLIVLVFSFAVLNNFGGKINFLVSVFMASMVVPGVSQVIGHLWSLNTEWIAYLIFPLLFFLLSRLKKAIYIVAPLLAVLGLLAGNEIIVRTGNPEAFISSRPAVLIICISEYILGVLVFKIHSHCRDINVVILGLLGLLSAASLFGMLFFGGSKILIILLMGMLILSISFDSGVVGTILASRLSHFLGAISYSMYLLHPLLLKLFPVLSEVQGLFQFLGYMIILILLSWICYVYIELKAQNYLNRMFKN